MLAARKVPARAEVDRGPAREPDVGRPVPPRRRRRRGWRSTTTATSWPPTSTSSQDGGAYPTPWPVLTTAADRHVLPRPVPRAQGQLQLQDGVHQHRRAAPPTAGRGSSRRSPARCCSTSRPARWAWIPSSCAAATSCAATRCRTPTPTACPTTTSRPRRRSSRRVEILDYEGFRKRAGATRWRRAATSASGFSALRRADRRRRPGTYGTEGATIRIEPSGKVNVYVAGGSTGNSLETTVVQLTADALGVDIDDVTTIQGDTAVTPFGAGTAGSRSGSMTAGAVDEAGDDPARAASSRSPRTGSEADGRRHRARPSSRAACAATPTIARQLRRDRLPRVLRAAAAAAGHAGRRSRRARGSRRRRMIHLGQRHPRVHLRGRRRDRPGHAAALHRQRGLRPDDQPQRRRGPDRRRHRAGHRRRAARAPRLRRRRQPARHDVRRLPAADRHRGARRSSTATSRSPGPGVGGYKGVRRGRRDRRRHPRSSTPSTTRWRRSA